jgi:hypothetical protein
MMQHYSKPEIHQVYKSLQYDLKKNTGMKNNFSDIENTLLELHVRWHSNATGTFCALVYMVDATIFAVHLQ